MSRYCVTHAVQTLTSFKRPLISQLIRLRAWARAIRRHLRCSTLSRSRCFILRCSHHQLYVTGIRPSRFPPLTVSFLPFLGIANFIVGLIFLPLRNFLAWGDPLREGRVFYVFAAALAVFSIGLNIVYRG